MSTIDDLLTSLGVQLARDSSGAVLSNNPPNPLPALGTLYAIVTETAGNGQRPGSSQQERRRLVLVMVYGAAGTAAGRQQLTTLLGHLRRRLPAEVDRHPGIRVQRGGVTLADEAPITYDPVTKTHYGGQRVVLTYIQNTTPIA